MHGEWMLQSMAEEGSVKVIDGYARRCCLLSESKHAECVTVKRA